eukprot:69984-Rhodomonas_salina.1
MAKRNPAAWVTMASMRYGCEPCGTLNCSSSRLPRGSFRSKAVAMWCSNRESRPWQPRTRVVRLPAARRRPIEGMGPRGGVGHFYMAS